MQLIVEVLNITTGGARIALLSEQSANLLGVHSSDRIKISYRNREMIAIANIAANFPPNRIGLYEETAAALGVKEDETVQVQLAPLPESLFNIRAKLHGERLREKDIVAIVKDVVERHLSTPEINRVPHRPEHPRLKHRGNRSPLQSHDCNGQDPEFRRRTHPRQAQRRRHPRRQNQHARRAHRRRSRLHNTQNFLTRHHFARGNG